MTLDFESLKKENEQWVMQEDIKCYQIARNKIVRDSMIASVDEYDKLNNEIIELSADELIRSIE